MANPLYPNVPHAPGVPAINFLRNPGFEFRGDGLADQDSVQSLPANSLQWGVFSDRGALVLEPDNIGGIEFAKEYQIADYPQEAGQFGSYNKVARPFTNMVTMSKGGSLSDRQTFETTLQHLAASLDLYTIVTPERAYLNCNIAVVRLSRNLDRGAGMLTFEVGFQEIRVAGEIQFDEDDTGSTVSGTDTTVPTTTPNTPPAPTKPKVQATRSPASARKRSRGAIQPKVPSPDSDAALLKQGFKKIPGAPKGFQDWSGPL